MTEQTEDTDRTSTESPIESVSLERLQWAEVLMALAKAEDNEDASEKAQQRWGEALDDIKEQVQPHALDLVELQETVYERSDSSWVTDCAGD